MKKINIIYWIFTGLFAAFMLLSAIQEIINTPDSEKLLHGQLGYPIYFSAFLGVAKILGVIAIVVPGFPKLREWAYAGFTFDLIGATYSNFVVAKQTNGPIAPIFFMLIFFAVLIVSYRYNIKRQKAQTINA